MSFKMLTTLKIVFILLFDMLFWFRSVLPCVYPSCLTKRLLVVVHFCSESLDTIYFTPKTITMKTSAQAILFAVVAVLLSLHVSSAAECKSGNLKGVCGGICQALPKICPSGCDDPNATKGCRRTCFRAETNDCFGE